MKYPSSARERAEARFDKAQRSTDEARAITDSELSAARKKTERLRKLRLARESGEGITEIDAKPAKKKPAARKAAKRR
jgi:hypothetical protein